MRQCSGPPFNVTFSWPSNVSGGSAVGDTFVTWIPSDRPDDDVHRRIRGTGLSGETSFVRFGPNLSPDRMSEERLARHETRHLDQWAVFSIAGGPLAFPLTYWADSLLFPSSRSHFERDAGLADGAYPEPSGYGPAPLWGPLTAVALVALLAARTWLRRHARTTRAWSGPPTTCGVRVGPVHSPAPPHEGEGGSAKTLLHRAR